MTRSARGVPRSLAWLNARKAVGRSVVLVLLSTVVIVTGALGSLSSATLYEGAAGAANAPQLPEGTLAILWWPGCSLSIDAATTLLRSRLDAGAAWAGSGGTVRIRVTYPMWASAETVFGPTGHLTLVRMDLRRWAGATTPVGRPDEAGDGVGVTVTGGYPSGGGLRWFNSLEGRVPTEIDEIAVPRRLAETAGLGLGSEVAMPRVRERAGGPDVEPRYRVVGIYDPIGQGPAFEYVFSVRDAGRPGQFNLAVVFDRAHLDALMDWGAPRRAGWPEAPPGTTLPVVIGSHTAESRAATLARDIFGAQSTSMVGLGFGFAGAAVFIILLVSLYERRREIAAYKLVGMANRGAAATLALELSGMLAVAALAAIPVYLWLAEWLVGDVTALWDQVTYSFGLSALATALVVALGGIYPLALAHAASPMELLAGQRVFLFRRRATLQRGT